MSQLSRKLAVNAKDVATAFEILRMPAIKQGVQAMVDSVVPAMRFILSVEGVDYPPSILMEQITVKYWAGFFRSLIEWHLCAGVAPYYFVPLSERMGEFMNVFDPSISEQRVPVCPSYTEGCLWFDKTRTGPPVFEWRWAHGKSTEEDTEIQMYFEVDDSSCPDPAHGGLRSIVSALFVEFFSLIEARKEMLISANLKTFPPLFLERVPERFAEGDARYQTAASMHRAGPDNLTRAEISILQERAYGASEEQEQRAKLLAEAADKVYSVNWGGRSATTMAAGDVSFELWKKRRFPLSKGFKLVNGPESKGMTREQYHLEQREFEDHAAALIGFESSARAPHSTTRVGVNAVTRATAMSVMRRRQLYAPILAFIFGAANWRLFEGQLKSAGVDISGPDAEKFISHWASGHIRVDMGHVVMDIDEHGNPTMTEAPIEATDTRPSAAPGAGKKRAPETGGKKREIENKVDPEILEHDPTKMEAFEEAGLPAPQEKKRKTRKKKQKKLDPGEEAHKEQLRGLGIDNLFG